MIRRVAVSVLLALFVLPLAGGAQGLTETSQQLLDAHLYAKARSTLSAIDESDPDFATAARLLGQIYSNGQGVPADPIKAVALWRTAAKLGDLDAMYLLGQAYERGDGVEASAASAYTWYDSAAGEHPMAALRYAEIALANRERGDVITRFEPVDRLRYAADSGVPRAQYLLAQLVMNGATDGIDRDTALELLVTASETVAEANTALGTIAHTSGNTARAGELFDKGLAMGDSEAAAYLGHYAEHGINRSIDRKQAWEYYAQASDIPWAKEGLRRLQRHADSIELLGVRVYGVPRKELWGRFNQLGFPLLANEKHWDVFNASSRLGGTEGVVTVAYAPTSPEYIAEVSYQLKGADRRAARVIYDEVLDSLTDKYGGNTTRDRKNGIRRLFWEKGDTRIELAHQYDESIVRVTYQLAPYSDQLRTIIANSDTAGGLSDAL